MTRHTLDAYTPAMVAVSRTQNDTAGALKVSLTYRSEAQDLTDQTLNFVMETAGGTAKVAETSSNVTVTDAVAGEAEYAFQAEDVDTIGVFYAWFVAVDAEGRRLTFPLGRRFQLRVVDGPRTA